MWAPLHKNLLFRSPRKNNRTSIAEEDMSSSGSYFLHSPKTEKLKSLNVKLNSLEVGHSSIQGFRPHMEDAYVAKQMDDLPDHILVAIMDGHAGKGASDFFSEMLPSSISQNDHFRKYCKLTSIARSTDVGVDLLSMALVQAYVDMDTEFFDHELNDNSGSTSVCAIITPTHILCANLGDSRCVVGCSDGKVSYY